MEKEIIKNTVQQAVKYTQVHAWILFLMRYKWSSAIEKKSKAIVGFLKEYLKNTEEPSALSGILSFQYI